MHQSRAVANYSDVMDKMDQQEKQAAIDAAVAYNESLLSNSDRFNLSEDELSYYIEVLCRKQQEYRDFVDVFEYDNLEGVQVKALPQATATS